MNETYRQTREKYKKDIWDKQKGKCYYCDIDMIENVIQNDSVTIDHFVPRCVLKIGTQHYEIGNIVLACRMCNQLKAMTIPGAFEMGDMYDRLEDYTLIREWKNVFTARDKFKELGII